MSKFEVMNGERIAIGKFKVYCNDFGFCSDYYVGDCNGSDIEVIADDRRGVHNHIMKFYVHPPSCSDIISLLGIPNRFIINKVAKSNGSTRENSVSVSILTGTETSG